MSGDLSFEIAQGILAYLEATDLSPKTALVVEMNAYDIKMVDRGALNGYLPSQSQPPKLVTELLPSGVFRVMPMFPGLNAPPGRFNVVDLGAGNRPVING